MSRRLFQSRLAATLVSLLAVTAAGCTGAGGKTDSTSPQQTTVTAPASAPPTTEPPAAPDTTPDTTPLITLPPVADPAAAEVAWSGISERIGTEGEIDLATALDAFSLSIAPLPGVGGPDATPLALDSATSAVRWLAQHRDELTEAQREVVANALTPAIAPPAANDVSGRLMTSPPSPDGCYGERPLQGDADGIAPIRTVLNGVLGELKVRLGQLTTKVWLGYTKSGVGANSQLFSIAYGEQCSTGKATSCAILITDQGRMLAGTELRALLAREVVHCYQATLSTLATYDSMPSWLVEGYATWASEALVGGSGRAQVAADWRHYLGSPEQGLFSRSYDAIGFFAHMVDVDLDPWTLFRPLFRASGNAAAFNVAIGGASERFLDSWPSSYARQPARGFEWDVHAPGVPATTFAVPSTVIVNDGRIDLAVEPTSNLLHEIDVQADIVTFALELGSHGRVGLDDQEWNLNDIIGSGFCTLATGCLCPDGSPPPGLTLGVLPGKHVLLAYTGGLKWARMFVFGTSLKEACHTTLDECLVGTWIGQDFQIPGLAGTGLTFSGGAGTVLGIDEEGAAIYDFLNMAPLTYFDGQTGTAVNIVSSGIATSTISTHDGVIEVSDSNFAGLIGRSWAIAFGVTVYDTQSSPGPAAFVLNDGGTYSCTTSSLAYTTAVDLGDGSGVIVTISFRRQ